MGRDGKLIEKGCGGPARRSLEGVNDCGSGAEGRGRANKAGGQNR